MLQQFILYPIPSTGILPSPNFSSFPSLFPCSCYKPSPPEPTLCRRRRRQLKRDSLALSVSYEVGGGFPDENLDSPAGNTKTQGGKQWDPSEYEALLKGGDQVTSVLEEMIAILKDMKMDEASAELAVELAAEGVIGKRVDQMESGFMVALDYMIQVAEKDQDDERKSLLEVIKETVLSHITKKCPPHVQVIGMLCITPQKDSRHELLRRVAAGGGVFKGNHDVKVHIPGANLNDIANQADDLLEIHKQRWFHNVYAKKQSQVEGRNHKDWRTTVIGYWKIDESQEH